MSLSWVPGWLVNTIGISIYLAIIAVVIFAIGATMFVFGWLFVSVLNLLLQLFALPPLIWGQILLLVVLVALAGIPVMWLIHKLREFFLGS